MTKKAAEPAKLVFTFAPYEHAVENETPEFRASVEAEMKSSFDPKTGQCALALGDAFALVRRKVAESEAAASEDAIVDKLLQPKDGD